ncbi:TPA: hypothetical protein P2I16_001597 [Aeromonas salmonicida]|nr:hypothetical protein [Aeromonas salmonicida]
MTDTISTVLEAKKDELLQARGKLTGWENYNNGNEQYKGRIDGSGRQDGNNDSIGEQYRSRVRTLEAEVRTLQEEEVEHMITIV